MASFELIKGLDGKNYLSLEKEKKEDPNIIGSKFDDFEILHRLGEGGFGKVYKVRSKLSNQIYAMKMVNIKELKEKNIKAYQLALNETQFLSELTKMKNPVHIVKYYKHFVEGDFLYIIIEYIGNGDMKSFIEAQQEIGRHIPEEELWNIFLQCMKGLSFVHNMGVIHRDIKPANLLMDNNMTIKLGDFGVSALKIDEEKEPTQYINGEYNFFKAKDELKYHGTHVGTDDYMAKEIIEKNEYDQKVDVFSMGVSFFEMCYYHVPIKMKRKRDSYGHYNIIFEKIVKPEDANVHYSKELLNIINLMLEEDKNKRQTSKFFLDMIQKEFSKKYSSNTSIDAIIRCLYSFKDLTSYYLNLGEPYKSKPITKAYIQCLNSFTSPTLKYWYDSIKFFRELLSSENTKFDTAKEIEPKLLLAFLIQKLHNEINVTQQNNNINQYYMKSGEEKVKTNDTEMLIYFGNEFFTKFNSEISKKFLGLIKNIYRCPFCNIITYSFSSCLFFTFDLETFKNQNMLQGQLNIEKCFNLQKNISEIGQKYCIKCLTRTNHSQFKNVYSLPDYMIISIQRGIDYSIKNPVEFKEILDLTNTFDLEGKKYRFIGSINKNYNNGKYYSIFNFSKNYFKCEGLKIKSINTNGIFNDPQGELIILFYESFNN